MELHLSLIIFYLYYLVINKDFKYGYLSTKYVHDLAIKDLNLSNNSSYYARYEYRI